MRAGPMAGSVRVATVPGVLGVAAAMSPIILELPGVISGALMVHSRRLGLSHRIHP